MDTFTQQYNLDRKAASRLLKVSVRTVDRYVKKKVLTAQNVGGRVWLNKEEVNGFVSNQNQPNFTPTSDTYDAMSTPLTTIDILDDTAPQNDPTVSTSRISKSLKEVQASQFFKVLYEKTKDELGEKQERLEIANYRVGQLEAQLKNSIPILEYHREAAEKKLEKAKLLQQLENAKKYISGLSKKAKFEEYNKKIFLTSLLVILALQPLWLLLLAK